MNRADEANRKAFQELSKLLKSRDGRRTLAFVGAGTSVDCGYPDWNALLSGLDRRATALPTGWTERDRDLVSKNGDLLWRAQLYRSWMKDAPFYRFLRTAFAPKKAVVSPLMKDLVNLPFAHFMTTNYDDLLQRAHREARLKAPRVLDWTDQEEFRRFIRTIGDKLDRRVVHLHGRLRRPKSIILTDSDYVNRYVVSDLARKELFAIFATQRVVFIGFSLNDPDLIQLLRDVNAGGFDEPRHFAILPVNGSEEAPEVIRARLTGKFGVEPIFYPAVTHHRNLGILLKALQSPRAQLPSLGTDEGDDGPLTRGPVRHPDDPQKGRWGGRPKRDGRELSAEVRTSGKHWYSISLVVESVDDKRPLKGPVYFHLHHTFRNPVQRVVPAGKKPLRAELQLWAYGAFTVGVSADGGKTHLELDLAKLEKAPKDFRES